VLVTAVLLIAGHDVYEMLFQVQEPDEKIRYRGKSLSIGRMFSE